ncbi:MAG: peptidoglycan bridge formation glycyltransferase FemA/FemB family protein [Candidatus Spechtbacteria bacterium]|nr:peptidoglycan bridge formation glycyltransferase FemA/FemB family protein [Candidatus Spechtbacteria bacterium]
MSPQIIQITDKEKWDSFVTSQPDHTFLHSWQWGEFNVRMGDKMWRFGVEENGELVSVILVILVEARRGRFLFIPHGPIFQSQISNLKSQNENSKFEILKTLTSELKKIAQQEKAYFIRVSPPMIATEENRQLFADLGFRPAPIHMHAETTWTLDLSPSEEELLKGMRKTTRNLIRRAEREGVEITIGASKEDIDHFYKLHKETVAKHDFIPFSREYIQCEVDAFSKNESVLLRPPTLQCYGRTTEGQAEVISAWYKGEPFGNAQGEPQASAVIIFYGNSAFYHHGASSLRYSNIPTAYAVQWAAIKEAKRRNKKLYNFWGITTSENPKHPWAGLTLFKKGFGGYQTDYLHAQDLPISWRYWPNWALESLRRIKRGL